MGLRGVIDTTQGPLPCAHVGWQFTDRDDFLAAARPYISDGIANGQWVEYVGIAASKGFAGPGHGGRDRPL